MAIHISAPLLDKEARALRAGDSILLSGTIYTARDAAHARLCEQLDRGIPSPIDLNNAVIYYVGPTPPPPGHVIGSAGPTTSYRMDAYAPRFMRLGMKAMIGKGVRSQAVIETMKQTGAVYFGAIGGAGALMARTIKSSEVVAYEDLESEAIRRLEVCNMPLTVIIDSYGNNFYDTGRQAYLNSLKTQTKQ